jgi:RHS repeat-associated protein
MTVTYTYGHNLIRQTRSGTGTRFYEYDGQQSTRQLTDPTGGVTDRYTYDAFGVLSASAGITPNVYLYAGEQLDSNVGFYYLRARYYAQAQGRFITPDPEEGNSFDPVSLHRYLYTNANPVNLRDPSGRTPDLPELTISQVILATLQRAALTGIANAAATFTISAFIVGDPPSIAFQKGLRALGVGFVAGLPGGALAPVLGAMIYGIDNLIVTHKTRDISLDDVFAQVLIQGFVAIGGVGVTTSAGDAISRQIQPQVIGLMTTLEVAFRFLLGIPETKVGPLLEQGSVAGQPKKCNLNPVVWRRQDKSPSVDFILKESAPCLQDLIGDINSIRHDLSK